MRKLKTSVGILLFAVLLPLGAEPHLSGPRDVLQGGVITLFLWDEGPLDAVKAELLMETKPVAFTEGFYVEDPSGADRTILGLLLPVPSTQKPGEGRILVRYEYAGGSGEEELSLEVLPKEFIAEEIPLSQSMSELRKEPDPEKTRQARELYALLTTVNDEAVYLDGPFALPLKSLRRTSFYGDRRTYLYSDGGTARSIHTGIDFSALPGTAVNAAGTGRVVFSGSRIITGETLVIEHLPGVYSLYYHLQDRFSQVGDTVEAGALIGTVGATGLVTGAHLHWEIRVHGIPVAPDPLMESPLIDKERLISIIEDETN